jgi:hypothetical protein
VLDSALELVGCGLLDPLVPAAPVVPRDVVDAAFG